MSVFPSRFLLTALLAGVLLAGGAVAGPARAQNAPRMPEPLQTLETQGAQVRYMGKEYGMDSWIAVQRGQEQYFYVTPDGEGMVMGLLFAMDGKLVTLDQVRKIQMEEGAALDLFAAGTPEADSAAQVMQQADAALQATTRARAGTPDAAQAGNIPAQDIQSPSEQLMSDIRNSNWLALGQAGAPAVYAFIDPQCPYCHAFINDMRAGYIDSGQVQLRLIPVGFRDETRAQAAYLLGAADPTARLLRYIDGDEAALPVSYEISQQAVERNMAIMQNWRLNVTPLIVYRGADGTVKIIQGRAKEPAALVADLPR